MSLAKEFEHRFFKQIEKLKDTYILRLYDTTWQGIHNPCDFIVYRKPTLYLFELKTTAGASLPFPNISQYQWDDLLIASTIKGVKSYILCWFYEKDTTLCIDINTLEAIRNSGRKSIPYKTESQGVYKVQGIKKHKYFMYDFESLFKEI